MKCSQDCPHYKRNDAVGEMDSGLAWFCTLPHSQCEDVVCLLRMMLWEIDNMNDNLNDNEGS